MSLTINIEQPEFIFMRFAFPIIVILLASCTSMTEKKTEAPLPNRWPHAVTYEIFVQSFCDSNGDGIGDLKGLTSKLDYIKDLGVEAIWLMPINPSPSYHKYDVTDYYGIHPDYGTLEDFKTLVNEAHQRDLHIIMDLVINHCSSEHPWFQKSLEQDEKYRDYFVWADMETIEAEGNLEKEKTGDSDNIRQWNEVEGQDELYFSFFYSGMPDLNYDNPKVREEVHNMGKFWLTEIGVDGFRLDAAKHIFPDHRAEENHAFWAEFKSKMEAFKPDAYMVGEVWSDLETQAPYAQGFSALFNFDLAFSIMETVKNGKTVAATIHEDAWKIVEGSSPVTLFNESEEAFKQYNPNYINTTFLTNHDQNRVMSFVKNDEAKARLAASILLTLPGAPYIYYGEEIGMRGMKPDEHIREPFLWSSENDSCRATWMEPTFSTDKTITPVTEQVDDPKSIYNHYRNLIRFRRASDVMSLGEVTLEDFGDEEVLAFTRTYDGNSLLVIHNLSKKEKRFSELKAYSQVVFSTDLEQTFNGKELVLRENESVVLTK